MPLNTLHHCSIRTVKLHMTRDFYVDVLGMEDGERPPFDFPGHWLYLGDHPVVHLIGIDPDDDEGLVEYLGNQNVESLEGSGAVDHIAFNITESDEVRQRIEQHGVSYQEREVPGMGLLQFFLKDPNGISIELNYWAN
ncbi:MAG: VOC family protein [SAR324 cluster bacterium]|nr:VOC family protein [SAR324 cluster bacterium]